MKCFLDMDGVLTDFIGGAIDLHQSIDPWKKPEHTGKWGAEEMFGLSRERFWEPMGEEFWTNLRWTKEGKDILQFAENAFGYDNICILTTPCLTNGSVQGKINWINRELPRYNKKYLVGFQKHFCASKHTVLVDDCDKNVIQFKKAGGHGILVPRQWNSYWHKESDIHSHLIKEIGELTQNNTV